MTLFQVFLLSAFAQTDADSLKKINSGSEQFRQTCALCHGLNARGGRGPSLIDSSLVRSDVGGEVVAKVIRVGRPEKGMPSFSFLPADTISDMVLYLHSKIELSGGADLSGINGSYPLKQLLTGDAAAGRQFFSGDGKCISCHASVQDFGKSVKKYSPVDLEKQLLYPTDDNVSATVTLPSGEQVRGEVMHRDMFNVAILDEHGEYRSWPLRDVKVAIQDPLGAHRELLKKYTDKDIHNVFAYLETLQ